MFQRGETYDLAFIDLTTDAHPMHIHEVTMQLIGRYAFNQNNFLNDFQTLNGNITVGGLFTCAQYPNLESYISGPIIEPTNQ